jgi:hypothetical protein
MTSEYIYMVEMKDTDGNIVFSKEFQEHDDAVNRLVAMREVYGEEHCFINFKKREVFSKEERKQFSDIIQFLGTNLSNVSSPFKETKI